MRAFLPLVLAPLLAGACSSSSGSGFGDAGATDAKNVDTKDGSAGTADVHSLAPTPDSGVPTTAPSGPAVVYGQSASTLYAVDPTTKAVTTVADFTGCDSAVIDIALDKDSNMYATTFGGVYTINTTTAACHLIASGSSYPNSLSFVPAGTLDPNVEALVGYSGSTYLRIDTSTGAITQVGSLGPDYSSSGDIVAVIGGGTYLTVTGGDACSESDCLVEVNPKTGALITNYGPTGYSDVYGLAFWAGTVYGFDDTGDLFQVTFSQNTIHVTDISIPNAANTTGDLSFYGAGSSTSAPSQPTSK